MLIKLSGGVKAELSDIKQELQVGCPVLRYTYSKAYDKGEVAEINGDEVIVDFVDTVRRFEKNSIGFVYGNGQDEHWAVFEDGDIVKDYRGKLTPPPNIQSLEDLLDFDKWMV